MNQKKKGIAIAYISLFVNTIISIFLTPYLMKQLGVDNYGVYKTINSFVGYMHLVNFGTGVIIVRYVAQYTNENRSSDLANFFGMMVIITAIMISLMLLIGFLIYSSLPSLLKNSFSIAQLEDAKKICLILIFNVIIIVASSSFDGVIMGYECFAISKIFNLIKIVLKPIFVFSLLTIYRNIFFLAIIDMLCVAVVLLFQIYYCKVFLHVKISFHHMDKQLIKIVLTFSLSNMLQAFINQVNQNMDNVILGSIEGPSIVSMYSISLLIFSIYSTLVGVIGSVFIPQATKLYESGSNIEDLTDLVIKPGRYQFIIAGAFLSGFILFGKNFIVLWVGKDFLGAYLPTIIMLFPLMITAIQSVCIAILDAMLKRLIRSLVLAGVAIFNLLCSIILVKLFGYIGAAIGTGLSLLLGHVLFMNYYYYKYIGLNIPRMFKSIFKGISRALLLTTVIMIPFSIFLDNSFIAFLVKIILFCITYAFLLYLIGLNNNEKKDIKNIVSELLK